LASENIDIQKIEVDHLGRQMKSGFDQIGGRMGRGSQRTEQRFQRTDCWMFLLVSFVRCSISKGIWMAANKYAAQIVLKGYDISCSAEFPYIVLKRREQDHRISLIGGFNS